MLSSYFQDSTTCIQITSTLGLCAASLPSDSQSRVVKSRNERLTFKVFLPVHPLPHLLGHCLFSGHSITQIPLKVFRYIYSISLLSIHPHLSLISKSITHLPWMLVTLEYFQPRCLSVFFFLFGMLRMMSRAFHLLYKHTIADLHPQLSRIWTLNSGSHSGEI